MNGTVRVYGKDQISASSFCAPDNQDVEISVAMPKGGNDLKFKIRFMPPSPDAASVSGWALVNGVIEFNFVGWNSPTGTTSVEPVRIGDVDGVGLYVQLAHQRIASVNVVSWFVLLGGA